MWASNRIVLAHTFWAIETMLRNLVWARDWPKYFCGVYPKFLVFLLGFYDIFTFYFSINCPSLEK